MPLMMNPLRDDPEMAGLLRKAKEWWETATPDQIRDMKLAQRKSWVIGELMLEHPEITREEAEALYQQVVL